MQEWVAFFLFKSNKTYFFIEGFTPLKYHYFTNEQQIYGKRQ